MKTLIIFSGLGVMLLGGCAISSTPINQVQMANVQVPMHTQAVAKRLNDCIVKSNQSGDAMLVDSQIIAVTSNNPHTKTLFSSPDKLSDQQAAALTNYLAEANACRPIALEGSTPEMAALYEDFFKKIDGVYADLIAKKITIGVANQDRQLLIRDAHLRQMAIQAKKSEGATDGQI